MGFPKLDQESDRLDSTRVAIRNDLHTVEMVDAFCSSSTTANVSNDDDDAADELDFRNWPICDVFL